MLHFCWYLKGRKYRGKLGLTVQLEFRSGFTKVSSTFKILCLVGRDHRTKAMMARSSVSLQGKNWGSAGWGDAHHPRAPTQAPRRSAGLGMHTLGVLEPRSLSPPPTRRRWRIGPGRESAATNRGAGGHEKLPARLFPKEQNWTLKVAGVGAGGG